jgi:sugar phosphate isomerase/epimerase
MKQPTRREFIKTAAGAASVLPFLNFPLNAMPMPGAAGPLAVHIFSKHLQFLDVRSAGAAAAEMGFAGLDLTVRPNGHVEPGTVKSDLPRAVDEMKRSGISCEMIATNIESVNNPVDVDIIRTAAASGVKFYRPNWFKYPGGTSMTDALDRYERQIKDLSSLNKSVGITGCYQNHAGMDVGSSFWEVKKILASADTNYFGVQFDIRHAVVEGGFSWENALTLLLPQIKVIVLKDFRWEKVNGAWQTVNVPVGEGMIDFTKYFRLLKKYGLTPPVSLHCEYPLGGAEKGNRSITVDKKTVFDAMKQDLNTVQQLWKDA